MKQKPAKRILKNGIPLNDTENKRFWNFVNKEGYSEIIKEFLDKTGLYLRGRCDGPNRSGTDPCGYAFISKDSFVKGHAPILFFDPMPKNSPLKISFRIWKKILPFAKQDWNALRPDRLEKNMRVIEINSKEDFREAVALTKSAIDKFSYEFDLGADLVLCRN